MIKEFKEFISQGNVLDMAIGVVMGTAFTAIVNGLVDGIIMPLIAAIGGNMSVESMSFNLNGTPIMYGIFLQAIINFLLIALVLFFVVKTINKAKDMRKHEETEEVVEEAAPTAEDYLREIRDLLQKENN